MKVVPFALVLLIGALQSTVAQTAGGSASEYENPVVAGVNPDPSVIRVGSDYYMVNSSFSFFPGCPIRHSRDLVNWELIGYALSRPSQFSLDKNHGQPMMFAATIRYHEGIFYVITTDVNGGGNFYVTATNPAGPWSDPIYVDQGQFDPSLLFDDDGKVYYTRRGPFADRDIAQAEIDIKTGKLLTPLRNIGIGMVSPDSEGPHLYKIGGWYYLSEAEGGSRFLHMQTIGRSKSPWGPFEPDPHNPWISQHIAWGYHVKSTGHADLVDTPDGRWWTVYLGTRHANYGDFSLGRETFLAPVEWRDGWPVVKPQDISQLTVHEPTLPLHPWPAEPVRDSFQSSSTLPLPWVFLDVPEAGLFSLTERQRFLRLHGQAAGLANSQQTAFVGKRQREWAGSAATRMEFEPKKDNEEAGLAVFMSADYHYEIAKMRLNGKTVVVLRKAVGDIRTVAATADIGPGPLELKVEYDPEQYHFFYRDAGEWKLLGSGLTRLISSEVADIWAGMVIGVYSSGNGKTVTTPADFEWFEDRPVHARVASDS